MKLIIIYGPPAVGKLTVASELSKATNFKLLHNHLTVDLAASLYDLWSQKFWMFIHEIRKKILILAAKDDLDVILTFVYEKPFKDKMVKDYINIYKKNGGEVYLVKLICDLDEMKKRVVNKERKKYLKINKASDLENYMKSADLLSKIPNEESLELNTTIKEPSEIVDNIITYYKIIKSV